MPLNNLRFLPVIILTGLFIACNQDKEDPTPEEPVINLMVNGSESISNFTSDVGDTIVFSGSAQAKATIKLFAGTASTGGSSSTLVTFDGDSSSTEFIIDPIRYVVDFTSSGQVISFTFVLTDLHENKDTVAFDVQVNESPILEVDTRFLGGYGHSTYGNLLNVLEDTAYFPSNVRISEENQEGVDIIVAYDTDAGWSLSAPDDPDAPATWNESVNFNWPFFVRNSTRLIALPEDFEYDEVQTSVQLEDLFGSDGSSILSGLGEGQVVAFRLDLGKGGKAGVLQVVDISGNKADNRQMQIAFKIQK